MKSEYKDFVGIYSDVYADGYCPHVIKQFDELQERGVGSNRINSENASRHRKDDYQIGLNLRGQNAEWFNNQDVSNIFFNGLQDCYNDYVAKFSTLQDLNITASIVKMQKTSPGGGYHVWHAEQGPGEHASRVLVYILYLNTLKPEEAGETEFLYQQLRIPPVENTMVLWPAAFTHAHRGNTVFGTTSKYIITGWFYLT